MSRLFKPNKNFKWNDFKVVGEVCEIYIKSAFGDFTALIDSEDLPRVKMFKWKVSRMGSGKFRVRTCFGNQNTGGLFEMSIHRLITSFEWDLVDHINGDPLDNRKSNLRSGTVSSNRANTIHRRGKRLAGVVIYKKSFGARVIFQKKIHLFGGFSTQEDAHEKYKQEHVNLFKEHSIYFQGEKK